MARNAELIRQWEILREIDGARNGIPIGKLAALRKVHQRTIRRDVDALCRAGFPLYDEKINGTTMWKLRAKPFRALEETGLGITELCALYFSRSILQTLAGAPFHDDVERAFWKVEKALPAQCRKYLDQFPSMLKAKMSGRKRQDERHTREVLGRAVDAALLHRRVEMSYASASSGRTKTYVIDPLRLTYAHGGIYLMAYVEAYEQVRTFAVERIRSFAALDEQFKPRALPSEPFANSLGVYSGNPEPIEIEFDPTLAPFVKERDWHPSQVIEDLADGSIVLRLDVSVDPPLRSWILGFGAHARVLAPARLAEEISADLAEALRRYAPSVPAEAPGVRRPTRPLKMTARRPLAS